MNEQKRKLMNIQPNTPLMLRTVEPSGVSDKGFVWPLTVGAHTRCPDPDPDPARDCGGGLHGLPNGEGHGHLLLWADSAVWIVFAPLDAAEVVYSSGIARCFGEVEILHVGTQHSATSYIVERRPASSVVGSTVTAGAHGQATAGYDGQAIAGYDGHATAGVYGQAIAGKYGQATAGTHGHAIAGTHGHAIAGKCGQATAGYDGQAIAGMYGHATAGMCGHAIAGSHGQATAGDGGVLVLRWYDVDSSRSRVAIGYVGEGGILPNVPYKLDYTHKLVRADS